MSYRIVYVPWAKPIMDRLFAMNWHAMTIGSVIFAGVPVLTADVLRHELVHVGQWSRYPFGLFGLVYLWAGVVAVWGGGNFYWDNRYEVEARNE